MKNALIVILVLIVIVIAIPKKKSDLSDKDIKVKVSSQQPKTLNLDNIDFGKYPVPVEKGSAKQTQKNTNNFGSVFDKNSLSSKVGNKSSKKIAGDSIPDWVYENTSSSDKLSYLIFSNSNAIFFQYADCPIGKSRKAMVKRAIARADVYNKISDKSNLVPEGTTTYVTCKKTYDAKGMCYYNPRERKEGVCKCAPHYFLDNCRNNICIINPKERRIVMVPPNEEILTGKLKELKENW